MTQNKFVKLYVYELKQDDPRRCSSAKLRRFNFAQSIHRSSGIRRKAIVLNPVVAEVLSPNDREFIEIGGLVVVDCSWKKAANVFLKVFRGVNRRLPLLLAANPINYGKITKLSSVEALAAALYIVGFKEQAIKILSLFKWGKNFITLNRAPLEEYSQARSKTNLIDIEKAYF